MARTLSLESDKLVLHATIHRARQLLGEDLFEDLLAREKSSPRTVTRSPTALQRLKR